MMRKYLAAAALTAAVSLVGGNAFAMDMGTDKDTTQEQPRGLTGTTGQTGATGTTGMQAQAPKIDLSMQQKQLEGQLVNLQSYLQQNAGGSGATGGQSPRGLTGQDQQDPAKRDMKSDMKSDMKKDKNAGGMTTGQNADRPELLAEKADRKDDTKGAGVTGGTAGGTTGGGSIRIEGGNTGAAGGTAADRPSALTGTDTGMTGRAGAAQQQGPVAIIANGKLYTIAHDASELRQYVGQTVRLSGKVSDQAMVVLPNKLEVKQGDQYREVALKGMGGQTPTAQD